MSFTVDREDDLDELENRVSRYGFPVRRVSKGDRIGQGESIQFETPSGQTMELVADLDMVGRATAPVNPAPFRRRPDRESPHRRLESPLGDRRGSWGDFDQGPTKDVFGLPEPPKQLAGMGKGHPGAHLG
jgi:hypothetical protein